MPIGSIWLVKAFESRFRPHEINALLTNQKRRNIFNIDLRQQTATGRLQIGTPAGFRLEQVAGFLLECMAGFVGIRSVRGWIATGHTDMRRYAERKIMRSLRL